MVIRGKIEPGYRNQGCVVRNITSIILGFWISLGTTAAVADEHVYPLQNHTGLVLPVPDSWKEEIRSAQAGGPSSLYFSPQNGTAFAVAVTPIVAMRDGANIPDADTIRSLVSAAAQRAAPRAVEKPLAIQVLMGPSCKGYYFFATDRAPPPGEWKYLTEGIVRVGAIDVGFDILTNDGQEAVAKAALNMIRHARLQSPGEP
jgi:hypothetical protein